MSKKTVQQSWVEYMEKDLGLSQDPKDRSVYAAYRLSADMKIFFGKRGSVRIGRCASDSHSIARFGDEKIKRYIESKIA